jgi:hypothetical protein
MLSVSFAKFAIRWTPSGDTGHSISMTAKLMSKKSFDAYCFYISQQDHGCTSSPFPPRLRTPRLRTPRLRTPTRIPCLPSIRPIRAPPNVLHHVRRVRLTHQRNLRCEPLLEGLCGEEAIRREPAGEGRRDLGLVPLCLRRGFRAHGKKISRDVFFRLRMER